MFLALGVMGILLWICLIAAVVPAVALLIYVYRQDRIEKEPGGLLAKLVGLGVVAALIASVLEGLGEWILSMFVDYTLGIFNVMFAFIVVAAAEEGMKFLLMKKATWKHPAFDYKFDAIVYATFLSLGFAAFENIFYVLDYGLGTALVRALISIPGHLGFAVVMGYFYGRAKMAEQRNDANACEKLLWTSFLSAMLLHGFFDACLMTDNEYAGALFLIFIIIFYAIIFRLIKRESNSDMAILSEETLREQADTAARNERMVQDFYATAKPKPTPKDGVVGSWGDDDDDDYGYSE